MNEQIVVVVNHKEIIHAAGKVRLTGEERCRGPKDPKVSIELEFTGGELADVFKVGASYILTLREA